MRLQGLNAALEWIGNQKLVVEISICGIVESHFRSHLAVDQQIS